MIKSPINHKEIRTISEELEQFMYDRGEYDYKYSDRIHWLLYDNRELNTENINREILNNRSRHLIDYLSGEISIMDNDDELLDVAYNLINKLYDIMED